MPVELEFDYDAATAVLEFYSKQDIKELQEWTQTLDKYTFVPKNLSDKQLVLFYNACKGDMDQTKVCLKKYYVYRKNAPELFNHREFKDEGLNKATGICELVLLPGKSVEGYNVIFYRLYDTDYTKYDFESCCKLFLMNIDLSLSKRGPQPGNICLLDMQGIQFGHLTRLNPSTLRKMFQFMQEAMLLRVQAIHILNTIPLVDKLMTLCKPLMSKKLYNILRFHNVDEDPEKLFEIVPKSSLPSDLGGILPDVQTLHKQGLEELKTLESYFKEEEEQRMAALPDKVGQHLKELNVKLNID